MSIRTKIEIILLAIFVIYAVLIYGIQNVIILPSFVTLEKDEAIRDLERCKEALKSDFYNLDMLCKDWAAWDDTYEFVKNQNKNYINSNFNRGAFEDNNVNIVAIGDYAGKVVWASYLIDETSKLTQFKSLTNKYFHVNQPYYVYEIGKNPFSGIVMTKMGPLLFSSRPITTSEYQGPPKGVLLIGRFINEDLVKKKSKQIQVSFSLNLLQGGKINKDTRDILRKISDRTPTFIGEDTNTYYIYSTLTDINGQPIFLIRVDVPKNIISKGKKASQFAILSIIGFGLLTILVMMFLITKTTVKPLQGLKDHAIYIGKTDSLFDRIKVKNMDEIGLLAREFNTMMDKLTEARQKLIDQSFRSGISEMASGILHNIRNTLSPITAKLDELMMKMKKVKLENLIEAKKELAKENLDEERKQDLMNYVELSTNNILNLFKLIDDEIFDLSKKLSQVEMILNEQQKYSYVKPPFEPIKLKKLLQDSIDSIPEVLKDIDIIIIEPGLSEITNLFAPRLLLFQVFVNLLTNS